jgi:hypothetical protein
VAHTSKRFQSGFLEGPFFINSNVHQGGNRNESRFMLALILEGSFNRSPLMAPRGLFEKQLAESRITRAVDASKLRVVYRIL